MEFYTKEVIMEENITNTVNYKDRLKRKLQGFRVTMVSNGYIVTKEYEGYLSSGVATASESMVFEDFAKAEEYMEQEIDNAKKETKI